MSLLPIFQHFEQNFVALITSLPEVLEPYQSVNADGATVRRYAILNSDNQVHMDTHAGAKQTHSQASTLAASKPPKESDSTQSAARQTAPTGQQSYSRDIHSTMSDTTAVTDAAPAGVKTALTYMQRRYGLGLTIQPPAPASQTSPQSAIESAVTAKSPASLCCTFVLTIQPTDPAWDAKELGSLKLHGYLTGDYPKLESYSISVDAQQNCLSDNAGSIVNQLVAAEGRQHAGRPGALQQLLRFVDNR